MTDTKQVSVFSKNVSSKWFHIITHVLKSYMLNVTQKTNLNSVPPDPSKNIAKLIFCWGVQMTPPGLICYDNSSLVVRGLKWTFYIIENSLRCQWIEANMHVV